MAELVMTIAFKDSSWPLSRFYCNWNVASTPSAGGDPLSRWS